MPENEKLNKEELNKDVRKLIQMMKKIDFCMLTTVAADGSLHARPMSVNGEVENNGNFWFFTYGASHKVLEAQKHPQVNVTFSDIANQNYVAVCGTAQLVRDKTKIEELWKPSLKAWFPDGVDTPDIALLYVKAEKAEYWDTPASLMAHTVAMFQSLAGGTPDVGENKKVSLK